MAPLPLIQAVSRFSLNEERIDLFVQGNVGEFYTARDGTKVPAIRELIRQLSNSINPNSVARAIFAGMPLVADYHTLLVPWFVSVGANRNPIFIEVRPTAPNMFWEYPISQDATEYRYYVDEDAVRDGNMMGAVKYAVGTGLPLFTNAKQLVFASSINGIVTPAAGVALISPEAGGVGRNCLDWGAAVDRAPVIERDGAFENVSTPALLALNFSRVIFDRVNGRPFAGDRIEPFGINERLTVRMTVITDADNNWYTPTLYLSDANGSLIGGGRSMQFEKVHSARIATFIYSTDTIDNRVVSFRVGVENSGGHTGVGITGIQLSRGLGVRWIARSDFPAPDTINPLPVLAALRRNQHRQTMAALPRVGFDSDSITNQNIIASPGYIATYCVGEIQAALSMDRRIQFVNWLNAARPLGFDGNNAARSGDTSDDLLASLDDALSMNFDIYTYTATPNDLTSDFNIFTREHIKANHLAILNRVFRSGVKQIVVGTMRPLDTNVLDPSLSWLAERRALRVELNQWIRDTLGAMPNVIVLDLAVAYEDKSRPTGITGDYLPYADALRDGTHPSGLGAWKYGAPAWLALFRKLAPKVRAYPPEDMDNLLISAPFRGNGGLPLGRVRGPLPDGVRAGTGPGSSLIEAVPQSTNFDPYTRQGKRVAAFKITPVSSSVPVEQLFVEHGVAIDVRKYKGLWIQAWAEVEIQAWPAWGNVSVAVNDQNGAAHMVGNGPYNVATDRMPNGPLRLHIETMPFLLPNDGSIKQIGLSVSFAFFAALANGAVGYCSVIDRWVGLADDPRPGLNRPTF